MILKKPDVTQRDAERFWQYVSKRDGLGPTGECWEWTGTMLGRYGRFTVHPGHQVTIRVTAHRVAFFIANSYWPDVVCHRCDHTRCVRPDHLFAGSHAQNRADCVSKGRHSRGERARAARRKVPYSRKCSMAKLTPDDVSRIRRMLAAGHSHQACANKFGIGKSSIGRLSRGQTWGWLPPLAVNLDDAELPAVVRRVTE